MDSQRTTEAPTTETTSTSSASPEAAPSGARVQLRGKSYAEQVQMLTPGSGGTEADVQSVAAAGVSGSSSRLPHSDTIQASFGSHDVSGVQFHSDGAAQSATSQLGAQAYATGNSVAGSSGMDLHTAAHEAAHVVQQRAGVSLSGGVGKAGDAYEQHADAVADAVVQGQSAEGLLSAVPGRSGGGGVQAKAVQFIGTPLDQELPEGAADPHFGESKGKQRRYSPDQYVAMWEEEQGRKMTPAERETINRGCIGITATNLNGGGNPLDAAIGCYSTFDKAHQVMTEKNKVVHWASGLPAIGHLFPPTSTKKYVMFAKLFWSNQGSWDERVDADDKAFLPDEKGEVDMTGYRYKGRVKADKKSGYVNFDYGFWDDTTQCFWHANHMEHKDPEKQKEDPMKVLQSTKEKFAKGYIDFDRIIYCVAEANNYDAGLAAIANAGGG